MSGLKTLAIMRCRAAVSFNSVGVHTSVYRLMYFKSDGDGAVRTVSATLLSSGSSDEVLYQLFSFCLATAVL